MSLHSVDLRQGDEGPEGLVRAVSLDEFFSWVRTGTTAHVSGWAMTHLVGWNRVPENGDIVLARVTEVGSPNYIEHVPFEMQDIDRVCDVPALAPVMRRVSYGQQDVLPGQVFVGVMGTRYAFDTYRVIVPTHPVRECDFVQFGGVCGRVIDANRREGKPSRVEILGYLADSDGLVANTFQHTPHVRPSVIDENTKIVLIAGGVMETGKTTSGQKLIHALVQAGHDVVCGKVAGCGTLRDPHTLSSGGARLTTHFTALGWPSTWGASKAELVKIFWDTVHLLNQDPLEDGRKRFIVLEVSDGLGLSDTRAFFEDEGIRSVVSHVIFAYRNSVEAAYAYKYFISQGMGSPIFCGVMGDSDIGIEETRELTGDYSLRCFYTGKGSELDWQKTASLFD